MRRGAPPVRPAAFALDAARPLSLPDGVSDAALWHVLTHRVMRRPGDLAEHARRIHLCRRPALHARAAGAFADLLHVLDGRGEALAARLLAGLVDVLAPAERELLGSWLAGEVPTRDRVEALPGSVLPTLPRVPDAFVARARPDEAARSRARCR